MALPIDVTDPGLINVEDQAFPPVPGDNQALPFNLGDLLSASLFAAPPPQNPAQSGTIPSAANVNNQAFVPASLSLGAATPATPNIDVKTQNSVQPNPGDFTVSPVGNFQTNIPGSQITLTETAIVDADTGVAPGASTLRYRIFVSGAVLTSLGLSIAGRQVIFTGNVTAGIAGFSRNIIAFTFNSIIVLVTELGTAFNPLGPTPAVGDSMTLVTDRQGSEVIFDLVMAPVDVFLLTSTPAVTAPAVQSFPTTRQADAGVSSGVVIPFVGTGVQVPPLLINPVDVAAQSVVGAGLPQNVFI